MAGIMGKVPPYPENPDEGTLFEWMWWQWEFKYRLDDGGQPSGDGKWWIKKVLDSPSKFTPGLIYFTPNDEPVGGGDEPSYEYDWWWIPHETDSETGVITTRGRLFYRETKNPQTKTQFETNPVLENNENTEEMFHWVEVKTRTVSDPSLRGERGKTIWADYGDPESNLLIDGERPSGNTGPIGPGDEGTMWPYLGDVDDLLGDMYLDLQSCKLFGPKFMNTNGNIPGWGDGISLLGPEWARWRDKWGCGQVYTKAPHDVVSHRQWNKDVRETFICVEDHTGSCDEPPVLVKTIGCSFATEIESLGHGVPIDPSSSGFYLRVKRGPSESDWEHWWFKLSCHKFVENGDEGTYYGGATGLPDGEVINDDAGVHPSGGYDRFSTNHHLVEIRIGGPRAGDFRFMEYNNGSAQWNTDGHGGSNGDGGQYGWWHASSPYGDGYNYAYDNTGNCPWRAAWFPPCTAVNSDSSSYFPGFWEDNNDDSSQTLGAEGPKKINPSIIKDNVTAVCKQLYLDYSMNGNGWGLNFNIVETALSDSTGTWGSMSFTSKFTKASGIVDTTYPKFLASVDGMPRHQGDCFGNNEGNEAQYCSQSNDYLPDSDIWTVFRNSPCGDDERFFTSYEESQSSAFDPQAHEPYEGSPYWELMLGADTLRALWDPTNTGSYFGQWNSGVQFNFGGYTKIAPQTAGASVQELWWRDYKTFEQWPGGSLTGPSEADVRMGETKEGPSSGNEAEDFATPKPSINISGAYIQEWGMPEMTEDQYGNDRWWRLVGREYNGAPKDPGGTLDWTSHGDKIQVSHGTYIPIPANFICLRPGNTYKITMGALVKPQLNPIMTDSNTTPNPAPTTWRRTSSGGTSVNPLDDFTNGWYELMLFRMPSQEKIEDYLGGNPYTKENNLRNGSNPPEGPWWSGFNPWIPGIGNPREFFIPQQDSDLDESIIDAADCLAHLSFALDSNDIIDHDAYVDSDEIPNSDQSGTTGDLDHIHKYLGSSSPEWSSLTSSWKESTVGGTPDHEFYQTRNKGQYLEKTIIYTPSAEFDDDGHPGDSWLSLYFDASWWGPHFLSQGDVFTQSYAGEFVDKGTIGIFPDSPFSIDEVPHQSTGYPTIPDRTKVLQGGFVRIEVINPST
jgi:hypothetical protein